jgi:hypothetical protein
MDEKKAALPAGRQGERSTRKEVEMKMEILT